MDLAATQLINAPRQRVWAGLNDPDTLKACIPGADSVERVSDAEYRVAMTAAVGPVKARFKATLRLANVYPPERYTLSFDGQGGPAGFSKGSASVALSELSSTQTQLDYTVSAQIGGKLAQVGQRLIDAAAKKVADDFFARFRATVEAEASVTAASSPQAASGGSSSADPAGVPGAMWVTWALLLVLVALGYFGG